MKNEAGFRIGLIFSIKTGEENCFELFPVVVAFTNLSSRKISLTATS
jgi:hypothetical protein